MMTAEAGLRMRSRIQCVCASCGEIYEVKASKAAQTKYCSRRCHTAAKITLPPPEPRACVQCGVIFTPRRKKWQAKFCSKACSSIFLGIAPRSAAWLQRVRESAALRGDMQRGRGEGKSYRKLNGRHEHRVIAERKLGRPLMKGEVVHHKDGDILNNDPSNLEIMTQAEHMREHGLGIPGVTPKRFQNG